MPTDLWDLAYSGKDVLPELKEFAPLLRRQGRRQSWREAVRNLTDILATRWQQKQRGKETEKQRQFETEQTKRVQEFQTGRDIQEGLRRKEEAQAGRTFQESLLDKEPAAEDRAWRSLYGGNKAEYDAVAQMIEDAMANPDMEAMAQGLTKARVAAQKLPPKLSDRLSKTIQDQLDHVEKMERVRSTRRVESQTQEKTRKLNEMLDQLEKEVDGDPDMSPKQKLYFKAALRSDPGSVATALFAAQNQPPEDTGGKLTPISASERTAAEETMGRLSQTPSVAVGKGLDISQMPKADQTMPMSTGRELGPMTGVVSLIPPNATSSAEGSFLLNEYALALKRAGDVWAGEGRPKDSPNNISDPVVRTRIYQEVEAQVEEVRIAKKQASGKFQTLTSAAERIVAGDMDEEDEVDTGEPKEDRVKKAVDAVRRRFSQEQPPISDPEEMRRIIRGNPTAWVMSFKDWGLTLDDVLGGL